VKVSETLEKISGTISRLSEFDKDTVVAFGGVSDTLSDIQSSLGSLSEATKQQSGFQGNATVTFNALAETIQEIRSAFASEREQIDLLNDKLAPIHTAQTFQSQTLANQERLILVSFFATGGSLLFLFTLLAKKKER